MKDDTVATLRGSEEVCFSVGCGACGTGIGSSYAGCRALRRGSTRNVRIPPSDQVDLEGAGKKLPLRI